VTPTYSIVIPTRHRPQFVARSLQLLEQQGISDLEVIVADNWTDPGLSCREVCAHSTLRGLRYVHPDAPLGMVDNWDFGLGHATGEYVAVFTDKIFLRPGALSRVHDAVVGSGRPEIVSWVTDFFKPDSFSDYFGAGRYTMSVPDSVRAPGWLAYDPVLALGAKASARVARSEQSPSLYCRGKIVFGFYHRALLTRIADRFGRLFRDISPDYTSMVLALSEARSAVELNGSEAISMVTDLSNGDLASTGDAHALGYLQQLSGDLAGFLHSMLVPGMYASQANMVSHDYLWARRAFGLDFAFEPENWLVHCIEDLSRPDRRWSSEAIQAQQMGLLYAFIEARTSESQAIIMQRLEHRGVLRAAGRLQSAAPQLTWASPSLTEAARQRGTIVVNLAA
jgi:hypothetical protein